jgi:hypothetical protein
MHSTAQHSTAQHSLSRVKFGSLTLISVLALAGCGGGGGGGGTPAVVVPSTPVAITAANAAVVAKSAASSYQNSANASSAFNVTGVVTSTSGSRSILDISLAEFNKVRHLNLAATVTGVATSTPCTISGTMVVDEIDTAPLNVPNAGDSVTLTYASCVDTPGVTQNGSATININAYSGGVPDPITAIPVGTVGSPLTAGFTIKFTNLVSAGDTLNGDITFSVVDSGDVAAGSMSGTTLTLISAVDGAFSMSNYSLTFSDTTSTGAYSDMLTMTTASVLANGLVTITTPTALSRNSVGDPTAGVMVITGANNSTLTLTALNDGVTVTQVLDVDGAAGPTVPVNLANTTWSAL